MPHASHNAYFETQVLTATPQRLRLMLIDGALRFARQALENWGDQDHRGSRCEALARCQDIVIELYSTIKTDEFPVARQVKSIYEFLLRELAQASMASDGQNVRNLVRVLEEERRTWQLLCDQMPEPPQRATTGPVGSREITAGDCPAAPPWGPVGLSTDHFSLEA